MCVMVRKILYSIFELPMVLLIIHLTNRQLLGTPPEETFMFLNAESFRVAAKKISTFNSAVKVKARSLETA